MHKVVLVEKYSASSTFWPYLLKNKTISKLSLGEIIDKYKGFEGELIFISPISENNKVDLLDLFDHNNNSNNYLLLHVISGSCSCQFPVNINKCGYDVGVCELEKTIYSSIFNEILFGHLPELIEYHRFLNQNLLFRSRTIAEEYIKIHQQLSSQGKGVEDYEDMHIYEIWKENLED